MKANKMKIKLLLKENNGLLNLQIIDKTKTSKFTSKFYNPENKQRIINVLKNFPEWSLRGLKAITLIPPERASLYLTKNSQAEYFSSIAEIYIVAGEYSNFYSIEHILGHEIGHHVYRNILNYEQKERLYTAKFAEDNDEVIKTHYKSHQILEEQFCEGFSFLYSNSHMSKDNIYKQVEKHWPGLLRIIKELQ